MNFVKPDGFSPAAAAARARLAGEWADGGFHDGTTLPQAIDRALPRGGGRVIVESKIHPVEMSGVQLNQMALEWAAAIQAVGLGRGDVFAAQLPMGPEAMALSIGAFRAGVILAPIVPSQGVREVRFVLEQSKAKALVVAEAWRNRRGDDTLEFVSDLRSLEHRIVLGETTRRDACNAATFLGAKRAFVPPQLDANDACLILYTSGTTSQPKGVVHSHGTILAVFKASLQMDRALQPTAYLANPSMGHVGGIIQPLTFILTNATMVTMDQWDGETAAALIERYKAQFMGGAPIFLRSTREAALRNGHDISSLRLVLFGGTSIMPTPIEECDAAGIRGFRCYGSTEHPYASQSRPSQPLVVRARTDGHAMPGTKILLVDDNGMAVPEGEAGEIALIGPQQFLGYFDPALNAEHFLPNGAFLTGDIGRMDQDGNLTVMDRKKDIIIRGGENISSKEVEDALTTLSGVVEAAAVAMPDARLGEKVCAYVVSQGAAPPTLEVVAAHFASLGIARYKTPERLVLVDDFPRTASGKIKKNELRDALRSEAAQ